MFNSIIMTLTGGGASFSLPVNVLERIKVGLGKAARVRHAWIVTAGTDVGITRFVAKAVGEVTSIRPIPLIGIGCFWPAFFLFLFLLLF